jgi:hypothetical protein
LASGAIAVNSDRGASPWLDPFLAEMGERGYRHKQNLILDVRHAGGDPALPSACAGTDRVKARCATEPRCCPGGNVTGLSLQLHEIGAKHVELMTELLPQTRTVALITDATQPWALSETYERLVKTATAMKKIALVPQQASVTVADAASAGP